MDHAAIARRGAGCLVIVMLASCGSGGNDPPAQPPHMETFATLASVAVAVDPAGSVYAIARDPATVMAIFRIRPGAAPEKLMAAGAATILATDHAGDPYIGQFQGCSMVGCSSPVFKVARDGTTTLVPGTNALDAEIQGLVFDSKGNLYQADLHGNRIWKVAAGQAMVWAGPQGDPNVLPSHREYPCLEVDGRGTDARFCGPSGLAVDGSDNVYVADRLGNTIRTISPDGVVTTVAGVAFAPGSADGPASSATFSSPAQVAVDAQGNVYVADTGNALIRRISTSGEVTTFAGTRGAQGFAPGALPGTLDPPSGIAMHGTDLYFAMPSGIGHIADAR